MTIVNSDSIQSVQSLHEDADSAFCNNCPECFVIPVEPQPHLDAPVFLIAPPWAEGIDRVAICLQVHQRGRRPLMALCQ